MYDGAFAMVWADGDSVLNKTGLRVRAVHRLHRGRGELSGDPDHRNANVVVPQNISATVKHDCLRCVTAALAVQLVLTLPDAPTPAEARDLATLWEQIEAFRKTVVSLSFTRSMTSSSSSNNRSPT
ncbi:MAG: hypothetical protein ABR571_03380 [Jatrophihabitans sp.]|uniref:hypothetical protein n=1 Tax=Jatrophihabitans sp. TaxID=1932789 RepID=UPI00390EBD3A